MTLKFTSFKIYNGLTGCNLQQIMEFDTLVDFFSDLTHARRRYPMIRTYNKYLSRIKTEEQSKKEVDYFKHFLIENQFIKDKKFTNPSFNTGKDCVTLRMDNFINNQNSSDNEEFWDKLYKLEVIFFPNGKPEKMDNPQSEMAGMMNAFDNNPIIADMIDQVKNIGNLDDLTDINSLVSNPGFNKLVSDIKSNIQVGKYSINDLTGTVTSVIKSIENDLDDKTKDTLKLFTDTMGAIQRQEPVDLNALTQAVGNLKLQDLSE